MKFTKAELKVIHTNLFHNLAMLDAVSMLENGGEKDNTKEAKIIKSILNKISKHQCFVNNYEFEIVENNKLDYKL